MRFDPKLIHPDEPPLAADGEIELPSELAALGEQLRDDAAHLAVRYPCDAEHDERRSGLPSWTLMSNSASPYRSGSAQQAARTKMRRSTFAAACAALAATLAALLVAVTAIQRAPVAATTSGDAAMRVVSANELPSLSAPMTAPSDAGATISLADLSSPELEALLDLWQEDPGRVASVAF